MKRFIYNICAVIILFLSVFAAVPVRVHAVPDRGIFVTQNAAIATTTVRGLVSDITAEVRGPSSSYTLTADSTSGDDLKALLTSAGVRYSNIECYDLSLTAVDDKNITRNPQFGDVTITLPLGSSMDPDKGTYAVYTTGIDGEPEKLSCICRHGRSTSYCLEFMTIHFSTYAIAYTRGGSTRVYAARSNAYTGSQTNFNLDGDNAADQSGDAAGQADTAGGQDGADSQAADTQADTTNANAAAAGQAGTTNADAASADNAAAGQSAYDPAYDTGKDEYGKDPYSVPKTGDRRYYGILSAAIILALFAFILIARYRRRETSGV